MQTYVAFEHQLLQAVVEDTTSATGQRLGDCLALPPDQEVELEHYLEQVWATRNAFLDEEEIQARGRTSTTQQYVGWASGGRLRARQYVGLVQYEGYRLEIFPKVFGWKSYDLASPDARRQMHLHLLYWLMYAEKIHFPFTLQDLSQVEGHDLPEILIYLFANHTGRLLAEQPYMAYHSVTEELGTLRGRLDMPAYLRDNLATGRWHQLTCRYEPFVYDNRFNRIVKCVTRKLLAIAGLEANRQRLEDILFLLDEVSDEPCQEADCDKVRLNPLYTDLEVVLSLSRMFLSDRILDLREADKKNFCLLLPMDVLFESFIAGFMKEHCSTQFEVKTQSTTYLAYRVDGPNAGPVFQLKNDILLCNRTTRKLWVLDTKYKFFDPLEAKSGIAQGDMYQMLAYALKREAEHVYLLYPGTGDMSIVQFNIPIPRLENNNILLRAFQIDLSLSKEDVLNAANSERLTHQLISDIKRGLTWV